MSNLQHQQGLNEVVINKVQQMIENKKTGVWETMQRLSHEGSIAQDYIAPIGVELRQREQRPVITFNSNGELAMNMRGRQGAVIADAKLWKLSQAITAHGRELDVRRSRELHELSGTLMNRIKLN